MGFSLVNLRKRINNLFNILLDKVVLPSEVVLHHEAVFHERIEFAWRSQLVNEVSCVAQPLATLASTPAKPPSYFEI